MRHFSLQSGAILFETVLLGYKCVVVLRNILRTTIALNRLNSRVIQLQKIIGVNAYLKA